MSPKLSDSPEFKVHEEYFRSKYSIPEDLSVLQKEEEIQELLETPVEPPAEKPHPKDPKKKKKVKKKD